MNTSFHRGDVPSEQPNQRENNVAAQFLGAEAVALRDRSSVMGSLAMGGSESLQKAIGGEKDMAAASEELAKQNKIPTGESVAKLDEATPGDKSANFSAMMASEKDNTMADAAMDNAFQNVEKKEA